MTCSTKDANLLISDNNGCLGTMSIEEGVKHQVEKMLKRIVKLNSLPEQDKINHMYTHPEDYEYIMNPSDDVTAAYKFKEKL